MKKYIYSSILLLMCACSSDEPNTPVASDEDEVTVVTDESTEEPTEDAEVKDESETTLPEETKFVSQSQFDNLIKGHLWACYEKYYVTGEPFTSSDVEILNNFTGGWDDFRGFKIDDGILYDYRCASAPGFIRNPTYQVVTTDKYDYNQLTGELTYDVPGIVSGVRHRRIVLAEVNDDSLIIRHRFGSFPIGVPTVENPNWSDESGATDEGSYFRVKLLLFTGDKEAEYVQDFVLMN